MQDIPNWQQAGQQVTVEQMVLFVYHLESMLGMELVDVSGINNNCLLHAVLSQVRRVANAWLGLGRHVWGLHRHVGTSTDIRHHARHGQSLVGCM